MSPVGDSRCRLRVPVWAYARESPSPLSRLTVGGLEPSSAIGTRCRNMSGAPESCCSAPTASARTPSWPPRARRRQRFGAGRRGSWSRASPACSATNLTARQGGGRRVGDRHRGDDAEAAAIRGDPLDGAGDGQGGRAHQLDGAEYLAGPRSRPASLGRVRALQRPGLAENLHDVVGLYVAPPAHVVVLSIDEKSPIQALDRTEPGLPPDYADSITESACLIGEEATFLLPLSSFATLKPRAGWGSRRMARLLLW